MQSDIEVSHAKPLPILQPLHTIKDTYHAYKTQANCEFCHLDSCYDRDVIFTEFNLQFDAKRP